MLIVKLSGILWNAQLVWLEKPWFAFCTGQHETPLRKQKTVCTRSQFLDSERPNGLFAQTQAPSIICTVKPKIQFTFGLDFDFLKEAEIVRSRNDVSDFSVLIEEMNPSIHTVEVVVVRHKNYKTIAQKLSSDFITINHYPSRKPIANQAALELLGRVPSG